MSYFGDGTAQQDVLDAVESIQHEFNLSREQLVIVLLSVIRALVDPYDSNLEFIRKKER